MKQQKKERAYYPEKLENVKLAHLEAGRVKLLNGKNDVEMRRSGAFTQWLHSSLSLKFLQLGISLHCLHTSPVAHQAGDYPTFCSIKRRRIFLLRPGCDASP